MGGLGRAKASLLLAALCFAFAACSRATTPPVSVSETPAFRISGRNIRVVAIAPSMRAPDAKTVPNAALADVTAILESAATREHRWQVQPPAPRAARLVEGLDGEASAARAGRLAAAAGADAGLVCVIERWNERVGGDYGVSEPAAVTLEILLVPAGAAVPTWKAVWAYRQEPLTYNLWNLWATLRGGIHWLTASEIARIGIDEAMARAAGKETSTAR